MPWSNLPGWEGPAFSDLSGGSTHKPERSQSKNGEEEGKIWTWATTLLKSLLNWTAGVSEYPHQSFIPGDWREVKMFFPQCSVFSFQCSVIKNAFSSEQ